MTDKIFLEEWDDNFSELGKDAKGNSSKVLKLKKETNKAVRAFHEDFSRKYDQRIEQLKNSLVDANILHSDNKLIYDGTGRRAIRLDNNMHMTAMRNAVGLNRVIDAGMMKEASEVSFNNEAPIEENEISTNVSNLIDRKMEQIKEAKENSSELEEFKINPITNFEKKEVPVISDISINLENADSLQGVNDDIFNRNGEEEGDSSEIQEEEDVTEYVEEEAEHKDDDVVQKEEIDHKDGVIIPEDRNSRESSDENYLEKTVNSILDIQSAIDDYEKNKENGDFSVEKVADYIRQKQDDIFEAKQYLTEEEETILREKIKSVAPSAVEMVDEYPEDESEKQVTESNSEEDAEEYSKEDSMQEENVESTEDNVSISSDSEITDEVEIQGQSTEVNIPKDDLARMIDMANSLNKEKEEVEKESENITELLVEQAKEEENNYAKMRDNVLKELKEYINSTKEAIDKRKADNEARNNSYDEAIKNKDRYQKEIDMMLKSMGKESKETTATKDSQKR